MECQGEDGISDDRGEDDDSNDLREYRHRIEVLNDDIHCFMDGGEDDECNVMSTSNKVHNLQVNTQQD